MDELVLGFPMLSDVTIIAIIIIVINPPRIIFFTKYFYTLKL